MSGTAPTPIAHRTHPKTLCLFDVDGTLTPNRQDISPEMLSTLRALRQQCVIGFVGGSDLKKIREQLEAHGTLGISALDEFDYGFAENGLTAYKAGKPLASQSFIGWLGEEKYKKLVRFCLAYISRLDLPIMRGTFVEFRNGMINVSPIGRNASIQERHDFEKYDKEHNIRPTFIKALKAEFPEYGLTYSIGGQISFDVFPTGWDKTFALQHLEEEGWQRILFFGDNTHPGGNDHEIFKDSRTEGYTVKRPDDTIRLLKEKFGI